MELMLYNKKNKIKISDSIFNYKFNKSLIHQIVVAYQAKSRKGTKSQKNRSEVSGSNKKPWRQKGTGKARAGTIKSPLWRSGGVTFAAKTRKYNQKVNKKMYKGAIKSIFSELIRQKRLILLNDFYLEEPKTKILKKKLKDMSIDEALIIQEKIDNNLLLASRNLNKVKIKTYKTIDPVSLINYNKIIITINAIKKIEEILK